VYNLDVQTANFRVYQG